MTKQQTFDTVAEHLLRQGCKSEAFVDPPGRTFCRLRGDAGRKCAVGCLIPDDRYDPAMEAKALTYTAPGDLQSVAAIVVDELGHDRKLLRVLQHVHDACKPRNWYNELYAVARQFYLDTAKLVSVRRRGVIAVTR